jgi:methionyl-tRNA formyltransferase
VAQTTPPLTFPTKHREEVQNNPPVYCEGFLPIYHPVMLKIFETEKLFCEHSLAPGTIVTDCKTYFKIASSDGYVNVLSLQLAGKKRMEINDFLRGYRHTEKAYVK